MKSIVALSVRSERNHPISNFGDRLLDFLNDDSFLLIHHREYLVKLLHDTLVLHHVVHDLNTVNGYEKRAHVVVEYRSKLKRKEQSCKDYAEEGKEISNYLSDSSQTVDCIHQERLPESGVRCS